MFVLLTLALSLQDEPRELQKAAEDVRARLKEAQTDDERAALKEKLADLERRLAGFRDGKPGEFRKGEGQDPRERELMRAVEELRGRLKQAENDEERAQIKEKLARMEEELAAARKGRAKPEFGPGRFEKRPPEPGFEKRGPEQGFDKRPPPFMKEPPRMPPEIAKLEGLSQDLGARLHAAKDEKERAGIKEELRKVLGDLFELKEAQRRREVEELSRQLEVLRGQMKVRAENRDKIIDKRMQQLAGEGDGLDW